MPSIKAIFEDAGWNVVCEILGDRDTEVSFNATKGNISINNLLENKIVWKNLDISKVIAIYNPKTKLYAFNMDCFDAFKISKDTRDTKDTKNIKLDELKRQLLKLAELAELVEHTNL